MSEARNVYQKLMDVRTGLLAQSIKKSGAQQGRNKKYFELGDFLPQAMALFAKFDLCPMVSFAEDLAVLTIRDMMEPDADKGTIIFTTPMSTANLPNCHPVQNLGAVQTYLRRYLYMCALDLVEHDALDSGDGPAPAEDTPPPAADKPARKAQLSEVAQNVLSLAQELCFNSADVTDWAMHTHNKKFGQLDEITQQTMYEQLRKKHGHYLAIQAAMDAEHGAIPDGLTDAEKIDRTVAYLKERAESVPALQGKPLRASVDMWHDWVTQLIKQGEHD